MLGHKEIKLNLSKAQILKSAKGQQIQIPHTSIGVGHNIKVHPETYKKLLSAHRKKKSCRIHVMPHELHGSGLWDTIKGIAGQVASPLLSGLAGAAKEVFPEYSNTIDKVRGAVRSVTGYGLKSNSSLHGFANGPNQNLGHFPSLPVEGMGMKKIKRSSKKKGSGIIPAGMYY